MVITGGLDMNSALKHTLVAMATAALGFAGGCGGDAEVESAESESTGGAEATEASCGGEGSCGATTGDTEIEDTETETSADEGGEASCGEGSCG